MSPERRDDAVRAGVACPVCSTEKTLVLLAEVWEGGRLVSLTCPKTGRTGWPPHELVHVPLSKMGRAQRA